MKYECVLPAWWPMSSMTPPTCGGATSGRLPAAALHPRRTSAPSDTPETSASSPSFVSVRLTTWIDGEQRLPVPIVERSDASVRTVWKTGICSAGQRARKRASASFPMSVSPGAGFG